MRERVESERTQTRMREWSDSVIERLNDGERPEEITGEGVNLVEHGWISRNSDDVDRDLVESAFGLAQSSGEGGSYADLTLGDGSRAVVAVRDIRYPEVAQDALAQTREQRARVLSEAEFRAWMEMLRAEADIETFGGGSGR